MAVQFEKVKAGDVLYDYRRARQGSARVLANFEVRVIEIDHEKGTARASWNGNPARLYTRKGIERLRRTPGKTR